MVAPATSSQLHRCWRQTSGTSRSPMIVASRMRADELGWSRWKRPALRQPLLHSRHGRQPARRRAVGVVVAAARDPYDLLGVTRSATVDEIKRAFRKKALKLHPDVNKAPDARERFMECKNAYQQLLDEKERASKGGWGKTGAADWAGGWGGGSSTGGGYGAGRTSSGGGMGSAAGRRSGAPPPVEESYGFEDFLRDLEKEISDYSRERRAASSDASASAGDSGKVKALWEELADIGEEFVEFLELELGLSSDDEAKRTSTSTSTTSGSSGTANNAGRQSSSSGATGSSTSGSSGSGSGSARPGSGTGYQAQKPQVSRAQEVEDELQALKRKLGMK